MKGFDSMLIRTLVTARRQLLKMRLQMSNQIRGLMKTFGLVVPKGAGSVFERNVLRLLEGEAKLARIVLPMLQAWGDIPAPPDPAPTRSSAACTSITTGCSPMPR